MRRREWTDPAPLEVDRPRLPWWTLLPKKLLLVGVPIIAAWLIVRLVVFTARRVYRYTVLVTLAVGLVAAYVTAGRDWVAPVLIAAWLAVLGGSWWLLHGASFEWFCWRQVRSEYRRAYVYAFRWKRTMIFADLDKTIRWSVYVPKLRRVRSDGWRIGCRCGCCPASPRPPTPPALRCWRTPSPPPPAASGP
jgi:DNA segregation ATPase FtsK/SpoIIIE, S-DNA-T family